jgi:hypothetical protein
MGGKVAWRPKRADGWRLPWREDGRRNAPELKRKNSSKENRTKRVGPPETRWKPWIELDASNIDAHRDIAMRWRTEFIQAMGKRGDDFMIILDVNKVFSPGGTRPRWRCRSGGQGTGACWLLRRGVRCWIIEYRTPEKSDLLKARNQRFRLNRRLAGRIPPRQSAAHALTFLGLRFYDLELTGSVRLRCARLHPSW